MFSEKKTSSRNAILSAIGGLVIGMGILAGAHHFIGQTGADKAAPVSTPKAAVTTTAPTVQPAPAAPAAAENAPAAQQSVVRLSEQQKEQMQSATAAEQPRPEPETFNNGIAAFLTDGKTPILIVKGGEVVTDPKPDYPKVCKLLQSTVQQRPEMFPIMSLLRTIVQDKGYKCTFSDKPLPTKEELQEILRKRQEEAAAAQAKGQASVSAPAPAHSGKTKNK